MKLRTHGAASTRTRTTIALLAASCLLIGGCNTVQGIGKDVEKVGEKTQQAAKKVSNKL